jgi:hypothetical protein
MTDDPNAPTPEQKAAAQAVLNDPDYLPEVDDPRDAATVDDSIEEEQP